MEVFNSIYSKNNKDYVTENYGLINDGVRNHSIFSCENVSGLHPYVRSINSLLNDGKTRASGVQQLAYFLPQCPKSVLSEQGERWMRYLSSILGGVGSGEMKIKACHAVHYILKAMDGLSDLQKALSSKQATVIVQTLASAGQEWGPAAFDTLTEYMSCFPSQTLSHKTSIEQQMIQYLDFPLGVADGVVCGAGKVYSALPLPGAGAGLARSEARGQQLTGLLALCHSLQDYLLDGIIEKESYSNSRSYELPLPPLISSNETQDPIRTHLKAVTRLINAFTFIDELISGKHNISISLVPNQLLSPLIRILQVEGSVVSKYRSQEHQLLAFLLPSLHQAAMLLLSNMLISVGESLDAYWGILADVLAVTLKGSNHIMTSTGQSHGQTQQASHTRVLCYNTLDILTQVSNGRHSIPHSVVTTIVQDITPQGDSITLKQTGTGSGGLANLNVKKKQRHRNKKPGYTVASSDTSTVKGDNNSSKQHLEAHESVVASALKLTETLFLCAGHSMSYKSIQAIQLCVLSVSQWLSSHWWVDGVYRNLQTRALIYATLNKLVLHPNPRYPPPYTQILFTLQKAATCSHSPQVLEVCRSGIASLSFILANPQVFAYEEAVRNVQLNNGVHNDSNDEFEEKDNEEEDEEEEEEEKVEVEESAEEENVLSKNAEQSQDSDIINDAINKESDTSDHNDNEEESEDSAEEENEVSQQVNISSSRNPEGDKIQSENIETDNKTSMSPRMSGTLEKTSPDTNSQKRSLDEGKVSPSKKKTKKKAVESSSGPSIEEMLSTFVDADPDD
ncbi:unnamed protein product, partial [Meganyctiphanes norvegica]